MNVPVGTPVLFYYHGEKNNDPVVGFVLESNKEGVLRLGVISKNGGTVDIMRSVYHIDHPNLKSDKGTPSENAIRNGGWDYHPWIQPPQEPVQSDTKTEQVSEGSSYTDKQLETVFQMAEEGIAFEDMCKKVRHLGLKSEDVRNILGQEEALV